LCLFIFLLPFSLTSLLGWFAIPLVTTIAAAFFLIEKMAIQLQDPFENRPTDTPVTAISNTIEKNLTQMINEYRNEFENKDLLINNAEPIKARSGSYFIL
jgi:putative membrane protein